jgi:hypothetical protein
MAASVTWPPPRPPEPEVSHRPWDPTHPDEPNLVHDHDRLLYIVVDELVDDWVGLSVAQWPHADAEGRLRFLDSEPGTEIGTSRAKLLRFLRSRPGQKDAATTAPPRIGMTVAARVRDGTASSLIDRLRERAGQGEVRIDDLGALLENPVDLTAQGRLIAKLAYYGAVLSTVPTDVAEHWKMSGEQRE